MKNKVKFLLDTNVFIEAYRRYYSFDIAPSFWELLEKFAESGKIISIDRIGNELKKGNNDDPLRNWAITNFDQWFMSTDDQNVFSAYRIIIEWVQKQVQFREYAKAEFASVADSWLIAYALAYNHTIVTHEEYNKDAKKRVLIPNVCKAFNIPYINTFDMLRALKAEVSINII